MQQIKGAVLKSRLAFVQDHAGKDGLERVLAAVPEGDRRTLRMLFTSNWYAFELGKRLDDAIVRVLAGGQPEFFERLGAASAEKNLGGVPAAISPGATPTNSWPSHPRSTRSTMTRAAASMPGSVPGRASSPPTTPKRSARRTASLLSDGTRRRWRCRGERGPNRGGGVPGQGRGGLPLQRELGVKP